MKFSKRLDLFGDEIFSDLNNRRMELEKQGAKIYNMSIGTPDFHTTDHIKKAMAEFANIYPMKWQMRKSICAWFSIDFYRIDSNP